MASRVVRIGLVATALVGLTGPAAAALDEIVTARGWQQLDYAERGPCRAEVRGNGQFYRIAGQGQRPGEAVRLYVQNADIKPIEHRVVADGDGRWREFYVPFVWHLEGGVVQVALASPGCSLNLSFGWARRRL
jgi:hypothetical protein